MSSKESNDRVSEEQLKENRKKHYLDSPSDESASSQESDEQKEATGCLVLIVLFLIVWGLVVVFDDSEDPPECENGVEWDLECKESVGDKIDEGNVEGAVEDWCDKNPQECNLQ